MGTFYSRGKGWLLLLCGSVLIAQTAVTVQQGSSWTTWRDNRGSADGSNYSALTQINRSNVTQLKVAWTFPTGDTAQYSFYPIVVDDVMYVLAHNSALTAIDARTGQEIWRLDTPTFPGQWGINYWESKDRSDRRILASTNSYLYAIDARTGTVIPSFGYQGRVNLKNYLGREVELIQRAQPRNAGRVFENLIILGFGTGDNYVTTSPGQIRAFDVRNGHLVWTFQTIPRPGEFGYDTWPKDAYLYAGGANAWGEISLDEARGIVYLPTGSPTYDFYGGDRKGDNLFGNTLLALDARTGKRLWHFQAVHHDIWDYDLVAAPQLVTVRHDGQTIDAVATAGKNGLLFAFNRVTGEPLWPIEERPVPQSDTPGEWSSPTQPFPTTLLPFTRIDPISPDEVNPYVITPEERARFRALIAEARNEGTYTPPGLNRWSIHRPGHSGGANIFSTSADPTTGMVYVTGWMGPSVLRLETSEAATWNNDTWGPRDSVLAGEPRSAPAGPDAAADAAARGVPPNAYLVRQGEIAYEETCLACHGTVQRGGGRAGVTLRGIATRISDEAIRNIIRQGRGQMPGFSTISDVTMEALLVYLKNPPARAMSDRHADYPPGVDVPQQRYFSGWGFAPLLLAPPWSRYTAYDLNTGAIKWQIPVGDAIGPGLAPGNNYGEAMYHGPHATLAITAGGLAFAGTRDRKLRAYDKDTGALLWSADLPAPSMGAPVVYEGDGVQYIVVHAVGQWMAFALP